MLDSILEFVKKLGIAISAFLLYMMGRKTRGDEIEKELQQKRADGLKKTIDERERIRDNHSRIRDALPDNWDELPKGRDKIQ